MDAESGTEADGGAWSIRTVLAATADLVRNQLHAQKIELELDLDAALPPILAEPS